MNRLLYVIVLACIVVYASYRSVDWRTVVDRALLASAFALLLFFVMGHDGTELAEQFTTEDAADDDGGNSADHYVFREDLSVIRGIGDPDTLSFYVTAFHPDSTGDLANKKWKSVATDGDTNDFELGDNNAVSQNYVSLKEGNYMKGPVSNGLGIDDPRSFVVIFVAKIGPEGFNKWLDPTAGDPSARKSLFQMFTHKAGLNFLDIGFSTNGDNGSLTKDENKGEVHMYIAYSDKDETSSKIEVEFGVPYVYAAVVSADEITLKRAKVGDENFHDVVEQTDGGTAIAVGDIASRQIEFNLNSANSIDVDVYNFAFFTNTLVTSSLLTALEHFSSNFNPAETHCPYGDEICFSDACIGIDNWADPMSLVNNGDCRAKIDDHCKGSYSSDVCRCWDPDNADYSSNKCKLWRAFIGNDPSRVFDAAALTSAQVADVKQSHSLTTIAEKDAAVEAAKKDGDRAKTEAVASENKRLIDFYKNAAPPRGSRASDNDEDGGGDDDDNDGSGDTETGVVDYWGAPGASRSTRATPKTRLRKDADAPIVNPYTGTKASPEGAPAGRIKRVSRLRGLDEEDEEDGTAKTGLFRWFRGLFSS